MKVQIKVNDAAKTVAQYHVEAGDGAKGKALRIEAQKHVRYELIDEQTEHTCCASKRRSTCATS